MNWLDSIVLGIVQGLTEFLPVSSSGHLVLFQKWLGVKEHSIVFDLAVHLGTVLSVISVYFSSIKRILVDLIKSAKTKKSTQGLYLVLVIIVGSVPTAIIGLGFKSTFESMFNNIYIVGICFSITATLLFLTRNKGLSSNLLESGPKLNFDNIREITFKKALIIGFTQGLAISPGISRSGATIAVGILTGINRQVAALFSFMLSIPAIIGASLLQFKDIQIWDTQLIITLLVGGLISYLAGIVGLLIVLRFVNKGRLEVFSYYLWALSIFTIVSNLL